MLQNNTERQTWPQSVLLVSAYSNYGLSVIIFSWRKHEVFVDVVECCQLVEIGTFSATRVNSKKKVNASGVRAEWVGLDNIDCIDRTFRPILLLSVERLDCDEPKAMLFQENVRLTSPSNIHEVHNSELIFPNKN